ncbi:phage morphogenesis protein [Flavobacterium sp. Fl-318]|uniref:Phage morphogenesis protein n=1 Tax=Flavobacterium cupriresistens TaxID=2893885 RepID=A0ABU4R6X5_9FLAO|nr:MULTISPECIES: phage morphogenesis protein [unclassified Flavobacterium]MDX6187976.1 phage morphogenesis protein [Flavobacterium sp. Fl-318]UFH42104.1 phage morphogenesis protein [Flavobacterium sp. F-323]
MAGSLTDLQKLLIRASKEIPEKALRVIGVEGKKFIEKNFRDQGFTDTTTKKWESRKNEDKHGRNITRYRTNRVGRSGSLNRYGSRTTDRAILVGFNTGGDKLKNSFKYIVSQGTGRVVFRSYKPYAARHNEGLKGMPKRQFIGKSEYLNRQIADKIKRELDLTLR